MIKFIMSKQEIHQKNYRENIHRKVIAELCYDGGKVTESEISIILVLTPHFDFISLLHLRIRSTYVKSLHSSLLCDHDSAVFPMAVSSVSSTCSYIHVHKLVKLQKPVHLIPLISPVSFNLLISPIFPEISTALCFFFHLSFKTLSCSVLYIICFLL